MASIRSMPAGWPVGLAALVALHAARLHHPGQDVHASLEGMNAVVIGRSNIVGKPLVQLLLQRERDGDDRAFAHARPAGSLRAAPIWLVPPIGKPEMVRGDWIKPGATVIDVGINRVPVADGKTRLVGDVAFEGSGRGRRRDHAGARRRRADDGGMPPGEYAARGVRDSRVGEAGGVSDALSTSLRGARATKQSIPPLAGLWIASLRSQ